MIAIFMTMMVRRENKRRDTVEGPSALNQTGLSVQTDYDRAKGAFHLLVTV